MMPWRGTDGRGGGGPDLRQASTPIQLRPMKTDGPTKLCRDHREMKIFRGASARQLPCKRSPRSSAPTSREALGRRL